MTRLGHGGLKLARDWVAPGDIVGSALNRLRAAYPSVATRVAVLPLGATEDRVVGALDLERALIGGDLRGSSMSTLGPLAELTLSRLSVDKAFLGADGVVA